MDHKKILIGTIFVLLYCIISAVSFVFINYTEQTLPPLTATFFSFVISISFCLIIVSTNFRKLWQLIKANLKPVLLLNISTAVVWLSTFYGLKILSPYVVISLILGISPIATLLAIRNPTTKAETYWNIFFSCFILFILSNITLEYLLRIPDQISTFYALLLCLMGGVAAAYNNIFSRALSQKNFTTMMVLSSRFWLLLLLTTILMKWTHLPFAIHWPTFMQTLIIALVSILLPLFFLQKGLERVDALYVAFLSPFLPVLTFFFQLVEPQYHFSLLEFILVSLLSLVIFTSVIVKFKLAKKANRFKIG